MLSVEKTTKEKTLPKLCIEYPSFDNSNDEAKSVARKRNE